VVDLVWFQLLSAALFVIGLYGVLARRSAVLILMSIELMLNAVNINLIAAASYLNGIGRFDAFDGQIIAIFVITVAAAEVGLAFAIILRMYRNRGTVNVAEINNLSLRYGAVNLGPGRPDFDGPQQVVDAAIHALRSGQCNQSPPGRGIPELMEGIARHAAVFYDMEVDPEHGVLVTPGATEASVAWLMLARLRKEFMMPQTVPNRPMNGAVEPTEARKVM